MILLCYTIMLFFRRRSVAPHFGAHCRSRRRRLRRRRRQEAVAPNTSLSLHLFNDGAPWTPLVHRWPFFFILRTEWATDRPAAASGRTEFLNNH